MDSTSKQRNPLVIGLVASIAGLLLGLLWAWVIQPVEWVNATPEALGAEYQEEYLRMAVDSFQVNVDRVLAVQRYRSLGAYAAQVFKRIKMDPGGQDPVVIEAFDQLIKSVGELPPPAETPLVGGTSTMGYAVLIAAGAVILSVVLAMTLFLRRVMRKRSSGEMTPAMQAQELSRQTERTNFENLGLAPPITQTMTAYVLGDDLYDESFSIDSQAGEFLGEYGVGISETFGVGEPKKVTALEIWLFDKNDIKTATKVLMSEHAYKDSGIRQRLEAKGELVPIRTQQQVLMETATMQLLATVVDVEYGQGPLPPNSYFERVTLELAIWPRQQQS